jgi:type I restriction enzyme S subunit
VAIAADSVATNQGFKSLVLKSGIDSRYAYYYMRSIKDLANAAGTGTTFKELSGRAMNELPFVVAPYAEQLEIARRLDALFERNASLKQKIVRISELLRSLVSAVLESAATGLLTSDWRDRQEGAKGDARRLLEEIRASHEEAGGHAVGNASPPTAAAHDLKLSELPACWQIAELKELCEPGRPITYGILMPGAEQSEGVPYIRVADFPANILSFDGIRRTSYEIDEKYRRSRVRTGDLLLSIRGSVGRIISIPAELDGANITQDTARISLDPRICAEYVRFILLAEPTQSRIRKAVRGAAIKGINIGDVRAIQIPLPSIEEQLEIASRVNKVLSVAASLEDKLALVASLTDSAPQSFLNHAFTGQLTESWRLRNAARGALDPYVDWGGDHPIISKPKNSKSSAKKNSRPALGETLELVAMKNFRSVTEVLGELEQAVDAQSFLAACGYAEGSSVESIERFFLDLRASLSTGEIVRLPRAADGQDWFEIKK